jgi:hypothetical protein
MIKGDKPFAVARINKQPLQLPFKFLSLIYVDLISACGRKKPQLSENKPAIAGAKQVFYWKKIPSFSRTAIGLSGRVKYNLH